MTAPQKKTTRHKALIAEDDPTIADQLVSVVSSIGHEPIVVTTLDEELAALEEIDPCYMIQDMQLPPSAGMKETPMSGRTGVRTARDKYPERNAAGHHVFPIFVVTSHGVGNSDFMSEMFEMGISRFISKPIEEKHEEVAKKILEVLERAGCVDHAACIARRAAPRGETGGLLLEILGTTIKKQAAFELGGVAVPVRKQLFVTLVRLVDLRIASGIEGYAKRADLKITSATEVPSRLQTACLEAGLTLPADVMVFQTDRDGRMRLHPSIRLGEVNWQWLRGHADVDVQKIAEARLARAAREAAQGRSGTSAR